MNRVMGTGQAAIWEMMDSVLYNVGSKEDNRYYLGKFAEFHLEDSARVPALEAYTAPLAAYNLMAHNYLRIALMNHYRGNANDSLAQVHRSALQAQNLNNNGLQNYCQYFELTGRIGTRGRSLYQPDSADVALLQQIALSGTGVAFKACRLLQFYHRGAPCYVTDTAAIYTKQVLQPSKPQQSLALLGQSYPNPTTGQATIPYTLPDGTQIARIELRELVTGRSVGTYVLPVSAGAAELSVEVKGVTAGVFIYTLVVDGASQATRKMVIIQ